ncbi:MAG: S-layer homology domain-containing protein [Eubacteriales bacterium]|nr:S-layer homology domain-containing protein [Eubacteriales bacterium]
MKKRLLSAVLALCMAIAMLPAAFAANSQQVVVMGTVLTNGMGWNNDGSTTGSGSRDNDIYFADGVLYLSGVNIETQGTAISIPNGSITIEINGENYINTSGDAAAVVFNADGNQSAAGNILLRGGENSENGMLEIHSTADGIVNRIGDSSMEIKDVSVSVYCDKTGVGTPGALSVTGSGMLAAEAKGCCVSSGWLTVTEYAALYADSETGANGQAISCAGLDSNGFVSADGDAGAINSTGNVTISSGTVEARVRRNAQVSALNTTSGVVSTNGLYTHAGISSLDAAQVTDFDSNYRNYRYVVVAADQSWLEWQNGFEDVAADKWYTDYVKYVNQHGLMMGRSTIEFAPNAQITRAEAVQLMYALSMTYWEQYGLDSGATVAFDDVPADAWYAKPIGWAGGNEVVKGLGYNVFEPKENISRQQFAQVLYAFSSRLGYDVSASADLGSFNDGGTVSTWAQPAMQWAVGAGIMSGNDLGELGPRNPLSRAEAAVMLQGFITYTLSMGR